MSECQGATLPALNASLQTEPARQIAWTLANYGGYICDDTYADRVGAWRVSRFGDNGEPEGHSCPSGDLTAAIGEALEYGADLATGTDAAALFLQNGGAR